MAAITYVGATLGVVAATPATEDAAGFGALTYVAVGKLISIGETGDEAEDVTVPLLAGRTLHLNGAKDGGARDFAYQYELTDPGQVILRAQNNGQTTVSFKITDPDGKIEYFHGLVANLKMAERTSSAYKGQKGQLRVNSAVITV